tara:strand:- start:433 stop:1026 length:594 start_codon:yes stop_codon:yes gene_type:complete
MRLLLLIFFLTFNFQSSTFADDIRDFEIEEISLGSSLLDFFTEDQISKGRYILTQAKDHKEYSKINLEKLKEIDLYDRLSASFKSNDKTYKVITVEGIIWYRDDIDSCLKKRDEIIKQLSSSFQNNEYEEIKQKHFLDDKSFTYDYYVFFGKKENWPVDHILVSCYDWSEDLEYWDHLRVGIVSEEYMHWLTKIAEN